MDIFSKNSEIFRNGRNPVREGAEQPPCTSPSEDMFFAGLLIRLTAGARVMGARTLDAPLCLSLTWGGGSYTYNMSFSLRYAMVSYTSVRPLPLPSPFTIAITLFHCHPGLYHCHPGLRVGASLSRHRPFVSHSPLAPQAWRKL